MNKEPGAMYLLKQTLTLIIHTFYGHVVVNVYKNNLFFSDRGANTRSP
jgi:hypothetical protein